jgi:hypothetical protein
MGEEEGSRRCCGGESAAAVEELREEMDGRAVRAGRKKEWPRCMGGRMAELMVGGDGGCMGWKRTGRSGHGG